MLLWRSLVGVGRCVGCFCGLSVENCRVSRKEEEGFYAKCFFGQWGEDGGGAMS